MDKHHSAGEGSRPLTKASSVLSRVTKAAGALLKARAKGIYHSLPAPVRYGARFRRTHRFLMESQWWTREALQAYQMDQLSKLLRHACRHVPYYRRVFSDHGLEVDKIRDFGDFRKLPFLTKTDLRSHLAELVATNIPRSRMEWETTGGSTAQPLGIYAEKRSDALRMAFEWRQWNWMGFNFGERYALIRGHVVSPDDRRASWWEYDRKHHCLFLSSFDLTADSVPQYLEKLDDFQPAMIRAYPSSLELFAKYARERGLVINRKGTIRSISTSSESLLPVQRKLIEESFQCPVFDLYGNGELAGKMGECEKHEGLHEFMEHSYLEILGPDGKPVDREGAVGELVVTGFTNHAVPLIRYKVGDLAQYTARPCSCGRGLSLVTQVKGRVQELILAKDGGLIPLGPAIFGIHDAEWTRIRQLQFVQEKRGRIRICVVKSPESTDSEVERYVTRLFAERFKGRVDMEVQFVNEVQQSGMGKHRFLIQKLPLDFMGSDRNPVSPPPACDPDLDLAADPELP